MVTNNNKKRRCAVITATIKKTITCATLALLLTASLPVATYASSFRITGGLSYSTIQTSRPQATAPLLYDITSNTVDEELSTENFVTEHSSLDLSEESSESSSHKDNMEAYATMQTFTEDDILALLQTATITTQEITFDQYRNITGADKYGTKVTLFLLTSTQDNDQDHQGLEVVHTKQVTVGASGVFSLDAPLLEGDNTIVIVSQNEYYQHTDIIATEIRRMPFTIRQELELFTPRLPGEAQ